MKKLLITLSIIINILLLTSCSNIGSPIIEYIDENNTTQTITVYQSNNEEYVKKIINILNSIKPKEYSYSCNTSISTTFKAEYKGIETKNVICNYNLSNLIIYNQNENIHFHSIINTQNTYLETDGTTINSYEINYDEYQYPNSISYIMSNEEKFKTNTDPTSIEMNFLYKLNLDEILNNITNELFKEYKIIIFDSNKQEIEFQFTPINKDSNKLPMTIGISPSNGLITSITINPLNAIIEDMEKSLSNNDSSIKLENVTVQSSNVSITFDYENIINIVLTENEKNQYK
jgi:hypothetical protein